jgi:hypothetical protein
LKGEIMKVETGELRLDVHVDDHVKVLDVGDNIRIIIHGAFGQEVVIEMQKAKYEEDMAPTWDVSDNITGLIAQITQHLLYGGSYAEERAAELKSRYSTALLSNRALWALKKEMVPAKAVADYIWKIVKAFEADEPGALEKENYIIALLRNPELCEIIMEA